VDTFQHQHKRLTVCLCHREAASVSGVPEGCQERLKEAGVGMDRWDGLAEAVAAKLDNAGAEGQLRRIEEQVARALKGLQHGDAPAS
jgi:hypothetical protein